MSEPSSFDMERTSILSNANIWYNYFNSGRASDRPRGFKEPSRPASEAKTTSRNDADLGRLETILTDVLHAVCREEKRHASLLMRLQHVDHSLEWQAIFDENLKATSAYVAQLEEMICRLNRSA